MTDIAFKDDAFYINGVSSLAVTKTLKESGIADAAIAEIVGGWFVGATGSVNPAPFRFATDVQGVDPHCAVTYDREFAHVDWVDGESRVQAGMTPEELGVNARFHAIENEFDAIAAQFRGLGSCAAELRSDLVGVVKELEAKITALQNEVQGLRREQKPAKQPAILGTVSIAGKEQFITQFGDDFKFVEVQTVPLRDSIGPVVYPEHTYEPDRIDADRIIDVVAGMEEVFERPGVREILEGPEPVTAGDLRRVASDVILRSGHSLGSVIATLPAEAEFTDANDALAKITEHLVSELPQGTATELKTTVLTGDAAARTGTALLDSGVSAVALDPATTGALDAAGIDTVARLSSSSSRDIAVALESAGLDPRAAGGILARGLVGRAVRGVTP